MYEMMMLDVNFIYVKCYVVKLKFNVYRTPEMAEHSELSEEPVSIEMVDALLSKFKTEMFDCLLFVNHINTVTVTEVPVHVYCCSHHPIFTTILMCGKIVPFI